MSYVDAGYVVTFVVLFLYSLSLVLRRRRLEHAVAVIERDPGPPARLDGPDGKPR